MRSYRAYFTKKERNLEPDDDISMWQVVVSGVMIVGGIIYLIFKLKG